MTHKIVELDEESLSLGAEADASNNVDELENELQDLPTIPKKFEGKSVEEVARSYIELEKLSGKQASELGQLRKYVDTLIQRELNPAPKKEQEEDKSVNADDLWDNPEETVSKIVKRELRTITDQLQQTNKKLQFNDFVSRHPDYLEVAQTPEFMEWVQANERRSKRYQEANYEMNFDSADELLSDWKELENYRQEKKNSVENKRKESLKKAQVETGSSSTGTSRKKWRRSELQKMRMYEPDKFNQMQTEIIAAYREGRVIDG